MPQSQAIAPKAATKVAVRNLNFYYGKHQALFDNNLDIVANSITAIIGPSGCGKSTHLRTYNRIYQLYREQRATGEIVLDGRNILEPTVDLLQLRRDVGMIFQKPSPMPVDYKEKARQARFLQYRGFSAEQTRYVLRDDE